MKKKMFSFLIAFAFILTAGICLTACGGGDKPNKLKIGVEQLSDDGIETVSVYTTKPDRFSKDNPDALHELRFSEFCYYDNKAKTVELDLGSYAGAIAIRLANSHARGDLVVDINGTRCDLIPTS